MAAAGPQPRNEAVARAMRAVRQAEPRARRDRARPAWHLAPPAQWMNDPNGPIVHGGWHHVFYQHNPYGDSSGAMHWGHARSRDLACWEHLPVALWPSAEQGEESCWSGCAAVNDRGEPMLFYTSIGRGVDPQQGAQQWAAVPEDDDLVVWRKHPANPLLTEALHGGLKVYDWRDPFFFRHAGDAWLVLGGNLNEARGGAGAVELYRALNGELTEWEFRAVMFRHPDAQVANVECPNFFPLDGRWVLLVSPHGPVQYFVGDFDPVAGVFRPEARGVVCEGNFYASNSLLDVAGNRVLLGWGTGFPAGRGWNGCMALPRVLAPDGGGRLLQRPHPALAGLRGDCCTALDLSLCSAAHGLGGVCNGCLEVRAQITPGGARRVGLRLAPGGATIAWDGHTL